MRAGIVVIACAGRLARIEGGGGIAGRHTEPDTVHLVSTAATPLGGDSLNVRLVIEPGARLRIRTVAAAVTLPGACIDHSTARWDIENAGELDLDPQPTVVAGGSSHGTDVRIKLADTARLRLRERVQIGRCGERDGFWSGTLRVDVGAMPLLRHRVELGSGAVGDDALAAPRACISELRYPARKFETAGTLLELARGGSLATWQGDRLPAC
ncbi:urease accessory protein UreD [Mycobacterium aquaticum]|uniref:Urease accessory protein n=1 Tax=Mycobacterium aquaticum TaxID=1927124 RepID=A0A1X0AJ66_9MYCO|nr:urease accessory protein UreD [Mycobacterium aquaticum]ORA29945.1 urease accessory protein [Mycobacterium aquaticum]